MRPLPIRWSILTDAMTTTYQGRRRALISLMTPSTTVVADDNGYALSDRMAWQPTITAHNVAERASNVWCPVWLGALAGNVTCYVAGVTNRFVGAVASKVTRFPTIVASLLICAIHCNMTWLVTVVAESCIMGWKTRVRAIPSQVPYLTTHMTDWIIWALACKMSRLLTVPAHSYWVAFSSKVADTIYRTWISKTLTA